MVICCFRTLAIVQSYHDVLSEASRLHTVVRSQSDLMKKLRERQMLTGLRRGDSHNIHHIILNLKLYCVCSTTFKQHIDEQNIDIKLI